MAGMLSALDLDKRDSGSQDASGHVSVNHNLPLQLLIIVGAVILAATFLCSLAWICCASSKGKYRRARFSKLFFGKDEGKMMNTKSWNPQKPGSVYDFGEADSADGLSLKEKSDVSQDYHFKTSNGLVGGKVVPLSPLSPMPALKDDPTNHHMILDQSLVKTPEPLTVPPQAAMPSIQRGRGWQLFDGPVEQQNGDLEAGTLPPARRPSFIDRLLAHRSISQSNAVKMHTSNTISSPMPAQDRMRVGQEKSLFLHERSVTTPALFSNSALGPHRTVPVTPAIPGSGIISAIGGAFRRVSQTHQQYATVRRKFVPSPRQLPIESDYEGTIGGKDADLPMARRTNDRMSFCGDSTKSPNVVLETYVFPKVGAYNPPFANAAAAMPTATGAKGFTHLNQSSPIPFAPSPLGQSHSQMEKRPFATPFQTPGMAGIGTDWPRRMSATMIPQLPNDNRTNEINQEILLDDVKRQRDWQHSQAVSTHHSKREEKLEHWILENQFAAVPPPDEASRRGSTISFVISERSLPSVSRQNSVSYSNSRIRHGSNGPSDPSSTKSTRELQRIASLRPHFAPMTSLTSWLETDPSKDAIVEVKEQRGSRGRSAEARKERLRKSHSARIPPTTITEAEKHSIINKYFEQGQIEENDFDKHSQVTDYDQKRGQIWEDEVSQPPSYRTDPSRTSFKRGISMGTEASKRETVTITGDGGAMTEFTLVNKTMEEEAAEKQRLKNEKRARKQMRAARRAAKKAAKEAAATGLNAEIMTLPAVQAALHELTDAIASSDSSKARDQALRHQMIDHSDVASEQGTKVDSAKDTKAPVDWVAELLTQSPKFTETLQANILMAKLKEEQKAQAVPEYRASSPVKGVKARRNHSISGKPLKKRSSKTKYRTSRVPIIRPLSPPESPLTSASEYPDHSSSFDRQRRCSMPVSRSFLVESRRGSQESESKSQHSQQSRRDQNPFGQYNKRITSMPVMIGDAHVQQQVYDYHNRHQHNQYHHQEPQYYPPVEQSTRRQLPLPPVSGNGVQLPVSAYDQVPTASVWAS